MMKGLLDYLSGESAGARELRSQYTIKLVPMMNPDGVVLGSYRCSMAGVDLNRQWKKPHQAITPTV